ncbi:adenylate and guanylate cyclase catalytic domain-containing protein [Paraphysoderma sedebokerense]|nr:adenylate and guanylate cyclase catalytic domain-containing protein [Paraphysoderma sedebokerense]
MRSLKRQQECEIEELKNIQEREYQMESNLRLAERKMLVERRTLNSILDTVIDGVINIDPEGIVKRFNSAAEKMFGYSASEVMGKNIKMLMPIHYSEKHDGFLKNYFTTGTKKVIGYGRTVQGQKKNGQLFPIHLSVSEVKEDDVHIFTGIIRDLTEEEAAQEAAKALQKQKQDELEKLVKQLDSEKSRSKGLIKEMLPSTIVDKLLSSEPIPPQSYDEATILFTDLCGFTEICSRSSPMDIVNMLNDLYSKFDSVITQYNVYKVETIGDAYMVVSGIPNETPNHAVEIAKLSVHLMKVISTLIVRHCPDIKLRMRIGIHSGPCVAGIVGRKMPRYCLFGDTVNTANRMESSGEPMKIHVSETAYKFLTKAGGCNFSTRGEISVKGKGAMKTYWLEGIDGFDPEVPSTCGTVYSAESTEDKLKL